MRGTASSKPCPPDVRPQGIKRRTRTMIVLGADTHKRSHTVAVVAAVTGELRGEQTVQVGARGFGALLRWARGLDGERVWALEDCRHVSGGLERFLIARGERVLRIPTHLTSRARRSARQRGKSDPIDALTVARVALQEGLESFPVVHLDGPELDLRLLVDHRERLVRQRVALNSTLQWHLHDLWPELQLLGEPGFGPLTAAKLVGEIAGAQRCATAAKLARAAGVAPIPASSGNTQRQRLGQGGNRQINAALHRVIVTRARCHPQTQDYIARRRAEGKTTREASRCLKRYLARHVWRHLQPPHPPGGTPPPPSIS